ncbi:MAG: DNA starvation/stationary phase protection protein [Saprospiraceae bacterium]|nr:DNA starvation/stationary phase protection protein [Saprospiraceae bacterium]
MMLPDSVLKMLYQRNLQKQYLNLLPKSCHKCGDICYKRGDKANALEIDEIAERIQQLGHVAAGSMSEFLKKAQLKEADGGKKEQTSAVKQLAEDSDMMARNLRKMIGDISESFDDPGTVDILTKLLQTQEKNAWMLRRYLS